MTSQEVRWCVEERDTGMPCASGSAPTEAEASREMLRYALQYGQDSPVRYWMRQNRKTLLKGEIAGVAVAVAAERERCAQIVEDHVRAIDGVDALAAIRGGKQ